VLAPVDELCECKGVCGLVTFSSHSLSFTRSYSTVRTKVSTPPTSFSRFHCSSLNSLTTKLPTSQMTAYSANKRIIRITNNEDAEVANCHLALIYHPSLHYTIPTTHIQPTHCITVTHKTAVLNLSNWELRLTSNLSFLCHPDYPVNHVYPDYHIRLEASVRASYSFPAKHSILSYQIRLPQHKIVTPRKIRLHYCPSLPLSPRCTIVSCCPIALPRHRAPLAPLSLSHPPPPARLPLLRESLCTPPPPSNIPP
jgi:hypothetical protein